MAPLPKRRWSTHRQGKKQKAMRLKLPKLVVCSNCKQMILPHQTCKFCGFYQGKQIVETDKKKPDKRKKKA